MHTNIEQYAGDEALYCHLGKHAYTNGACTWCGRKDRATQATTRKA